MLCDVHAVAVPSFCVGQQRKDTMALKENITSLVLRRRLRQKMPSVAFDDLVEDCGKVNGSTIMNKKCKTKAKVKAPGRNGALKLLFQFHNKIQLPGGGNCSARDK